MSRTLQSEGLLQARLFTVPEELVPNYNRALEACTGKKTSLTSFRIDRRGESPEIEEELGWNYLQRGKSDRYLIIVSPEQKDAGLLHEEFSFDDEVLDILYEQYLNGISIATRVDGLWAELDDGIRVISQLDDLLQLVNVRVHLQTPSGFIQKARTLQAMVHALRGDPRHLIRDDSAHLHRMRRLIEEVGDVRDLNLTPLSLTHEVVDYHTRLFGGAYVFRDAPDPIPVHRPNDGKRRRHEPDEPLPHTLVLHTPRDKQYQNGPRVKYISLNATSRVVDWLIRTRRAIYAPGLVDTRLSQMEDEALAEAGWQPRGHGSRRQALAKLNNRLPKAWHQLLELKRGLSKGYSFQAIVRKSPVNLRKMLLVATREEGRVDRVVENLLARLWPGDYRHTREFNKHDLERLFAESPEWRQDLIVRTLKGD